MTTLPTYATDEVVETVARALDPFAFKMQAAETARELARNRARAAIIALAPAVEAWADQQVKTKVITDAVIYGVGFMEIDSP